MHPLKLTLSDAGLGPSDHASFYTNEIPVLFFFSGFHDEYHTPEDTWKKINLGGEKDILNLVYDIVYNLSRLKNAPSFSATSPMKAQSSMATSFKVTMGIMPSYNSSKEGLEIDAISKADGPAAKAGIIGGDIIKSINNKPVKGIYDYMARLEEIDKGMTVPVQIERGGETKILIVTF
tara:strand:- start:638 stop:1171 length:534 start_codon:yes stop_codon:yes gene_type:complete